ncbi:MAG TPA: GNAT family N-acetyltransferase, partial [Actinopolymorphaceae bacterium]
MTAPARLETERLILRRWRTSDREPFAAINADPDVAEHLWGRPQSRADSDASIDRFEAAWEERGYGLYAVDLRSGGDFIGFIGLNHHRA